MAEAEGFEPSVDLRPQRFSRPPLSTAQPRLLNFPLLPQEIHPELTQSRRIVEASAKRGEIILNKFLDPEPLSSTCLRRRIFSS